MLTDFCLENRRPKFHPGHQPLTLFLDYGFNDTTQDIFFFMLILLSKEMALKNSIILYNDLAAISEFGQTLPFDCIENPNEKRTEI